jgi:hypothetical protein
MIMMSAVDGIAQSDPVTTTFTPASDAELRRAHRDRRTNDRPRRPLSRPEKRGEEQGTCSPR